MFKNNRSKLYRAKKNIFLRFTDFIINLITKDFTRRQNVVFCFLLFLFTLIISKLFYLQFIKHSDTGHYVESVVHKISTEKPKRGSILDRNSNILAMSIRKYNIFIDTKMVENTENLQKFLESFNIKLNKIHKDKIKERKTHYLVIAYDIDENIVNNMKVKIKETVKKQYEKKREEKKKNLINNIKNKKTEETKRTDFDCIGFEVKYIRLYPEHHMASHVIGRVNPEGNGIEGTERHCNNILTGEEIKHREYKVGSKKIIADKVVREESNDGENVYLTIDKKLQFILEQELANGLKNTKAKRAIGIIENPHTGEILAMTSLPDYIPGEKVKSLDILRNNAISLVIEPGSTFKIIVMSACLEEDVLKPTDKINCENGKFVIAGSKPITDHEKQKIISAARVIEVSSNIGTAKMALKLGKDIFYKYIKLFGFDSLSGIELNGEERGILREPSKWSGRSIHTLSFGQEISTTPLQIINAFSVIANGGMLLKPHIIKQIGENAESLSDKTLIRRVISAETADKMRTILTGVIENGTGKSAAVAGYTAAGKTGTAQKRDEKTGKYSTEHYYASFCGMIPAKNPEIVILIAFDEPKGSYYAASVAAPVFSKVASRAAEYLAIPKDKPVKENIKNKTRVKK